MIFPYPRWILEMPEGCKKERAIDEFYLRLACLYASRRGTARVLAELLDIKYQTLVSQMSDPKLLGIPETTYVKVENTIGLSFNGKLRLN